MHSYGSRTRATELVLMLIERRRAEKAAALVAVVEERASLHGLDGCGDAEKLVRWLRRFNDKAWLGLQLAAGYQRRRPPSAETRALVIQIFERRVDVARDEFN